MSFRGAIPTSLSAPQSSTLSTPTTILLSCVSCRSRKIKCSKTLPACKGCQRSKIDCVYPSRTRLPRGKQAGFKARNAELSRRLNRLESLVGKLGVERSGLLDESNHGISSEDNLLEKQQPTPTVEDSGRCEKYAPSVPRASASILTSDGARYLSSDFWSSLSQEVDGLKQLLNEPSDDEGDTEDNSPGSGKESSEYGPTFFIFNNNVEIQGLRKLHPPSLQMALLFDTYFHCCDPIFKILHKPTMTQLFARAEKDLSDIETAGDESLMFAMYFAAVSSMPGEECLRNFREEKEKLLSRYKYATEVALVNADFLNSMDLPPLQSLCIYLLCLRLHNNNRDVWSLTALTLRLAQALDLLRDGLGHNYSPFEAEMRRRLWWQITILDIRGSEDRGVQPMILESTFNTRRPLNINDEDINPQTEYQPEERLGVTDMTFCLITCETSNVFRRLNYVPITATDEELESYGRTTEKLIEEVAEYMDAKLLAVPCAPERSDLYQFSSMISQLCHKKAWLCCKYPLQMSRKAPRSGNNREELLSTAIWLLEQKTAIRNDPNFPHQWDWYGDAFVQWHPLSVALVQLCLQTTGPIVEHAWNVVETIFNTIGDWVADSRTGTLWKPIKRLYLKAQTARAQAVQNEMNAIPKVVPEHNLHQNANAIGVPTLPDHEQFLSSMSFRLPLPLEGQDQIMAQSEVTNKVPASYIPQIDDMNLNQQDRDSMNWTDWCEFVSSTWDADQAIEMDSGGTWNSQFGF